MVLLYLESNRGDLNTSLNLRQLCLPFPIVFVSGGKIHQAYYFMFLDGSEIGFTLTLNAPWVGGQAVKIVYKTFATTRLHECQRPGCSYCAERLGHSNLRAMCSFIISFLETDLLSSCLSSNILLRAALSHVGVEEPLLFSSPGWWLVLFLPPVNFSSPPRNVIHATTAIQCTTTGIHTEPDS